MLPEKKKYLLCHTTDYFKKGTDQFYDIALDTRKKIKK